MKRRYAGRTGGENTRMFVVVLAELTDRRMFFRVTLCWERSAIT